MKIALYTLGCKLNQSETEAISSALKNQGITLVPIRQKADFYIINTCTVTTKSEQKARRIIRSCIRKNENAIIIVTGCYAQLDPHILTAMHHHVVVIPQDKKDRLLDLFKAPDFSGFSHHTLFEQIHIINTFIKTAQKKIYDPFAFIAPDFQFHSRAFLKIQDGCDCGCAYCRVPLARGRSVSLDPDKVLKRIGCIETTGHREIVLTGVNISAYNHSGMKLHELLQQILKTKTGTRIRLSSLEPDMIDNELAGILGSPRICSHFHIPVQSGSNRILAAMKRRYRAEKVYNAVCLLKDAQPDCFLGADILTGFPGELDEDHQLTLDLIKRCGFSRLHVFQFSPRPGTDAFKKKQKVPALIKKTRSKELLSLSEKLYERYFSLWIGREVDVVLEKRIKTGDNRLVIFSGVSGNYLKLQVKRIPAECIRQGSLVRCRIIEPGNPGTALFLFTLQESTL